MELPCAMLKNHLRYCTYKDNIKETKTTCVYSVHRVFIVLQIGHQWRNLPVFHTYPMADAVTEDYSGSFNLLFVVLKQFGLQEKTIEGKWNSKHKLINSIPQYRPKHASIQW